jgi:hypothetical protein
MPLAQGVSKVVAYKKEGAGQWGTAAAGGAGAKAMRRVTAAFNLSKETYQSEELRTDYQISDMRHGVRSAEGSLNGELSAGSYADFMAAVLTRDFTAGATAAHAGTGNLTVGAAVSGVYPLTRVTGSWITDGFRIGDVMRISAGTGLNADVLNKNLLIVALTATVASVVVVNGSTITPSSSSAATAIAVVGKKTWVPQTGHTNDSFTVEEWFANIAQSEVYTGVKVNTLGISLPATGMATVDIGFMGKDLALTSTSQYFTSPTQGTGGVFAGVNGVVIFNGTPVAVITDASINVNRNLSNATVLGSNSIAEVFTGRAAVDGSLSVYFTDAVARNAFKDETEVSLIFTLTASNAATADVISITLPRVKLNSFTRDDTETAITASMDFQALLNASNATGGEVTTITIQDSQA